MPLFLGDLIASASQGSGKDGREANGFLDSPKQEKSLLPWEGLLVSN